MLKASGMPFAGRMSATMLLAFAVGSAYAQEAAPAVPSEPSEIKKDVLSETLSVNIPEETLPAAIIELSRQSKVQIIFLGGRLDHLTASALQGEMTLDAALQQLLKDSQATWRVTDANVVTIDAPEAVEAPQDAVIAPETVTTVPVDDTSNIAPAPAEADSSGRVHLEDVVVTATKRSERLRDIPQSITAFSGEKLEQEGKLNLNDYLQESAGVTVSQAQSGSTRITMRGINTDANPLSGQVAPIGIFIGDVPFTDSYIPNITPDLSAFDLNDVEILKGPQGTLFGGSALAGAVRYQLQDPVLGEWQARGFSQYIKPEGGSNAVTSGVAANIPLYEDKLSARLVYVDRHLPGVTDDSRNNLQNVDKGEGDQIRAILLWQPVESFKVKLTHLSQSYFAPDFLLPNHPDKHINDFDVVPNVYRNKFGMDEVELGLDFDDMRLTSVSSRVTKDNHQNADQTFALIGPPPAGYPDDLTVTNPGSAASVSFNQEIRLQSTGDGPLTWLMGAFYTRYKMHWTFLLDTTVNQQLTGPGSLATILASSLGIPVSLLNNLQLLASVADAKTDEKALFGDVKYTLWNRLDLNVGARLYQTTLGGGFQGSGLVVRVENNGADTNTTSNLKETGFNPKAAITWHFTDDISLYGAASKGFRFGGINDIPATATNGVPSTYKSDTLWNYELGLRTDWLDHTLRADVTLFDIQYNNPIIGQSTPGTPSLAYTTNVSAAVSRGVEANLVWNTPLSGLNLSFNSAYTDAHITEAFKSSSGQEIEPGQEMPGAARFQYTGAAHYIQPIGIVMAGASTSYTYIGSGWTDLEHTSPCNGYGTFNAGLTFASSAIALNPMLAINVSNILNVTEPNASSLNKGLTGGTLNLYTLTPPRTLNIRLSLEF